MADGKITFDTGLNNKQLAKDLRALTKKIERATKIKGKLEAKKAPFSQMLADLEKQLEELKSKKEAFEKEAEEIADAISKGSEAKGKKAPLEDQISGYKEQLKELEKEKQEIADALHAMGEARANKEYGKGGEKQLVADMKALTRDQEAVQKSIDKITEQWKEATAEVEKYNAEIKAGEEAQGRKAEVDSNTKKNENEIKNLESRWAAVNKQVEKYDRRIAEQDKKLGKYNTKVEDKKAESALKKGGKGMGEEFDSAGEAADRLAKRIAGLASRVFVFSMITKALRSAREYYGKLLSANKEFQDQTARLRGALATAFQPLYEVAVPALMTVLKILTAIVSVASSIISGLFGKSSAQSTENAKALNKEAKAISAVGGAADSAKKSLAGFDEINQLQDNSGGGGGGGTEIEPFNFEFDLGEYRDLAEEIMLIAAGFALWKISDKLPGALGTVAEKVGGLAMAVGGVLIAWQGFNDAAANGINWKNLAMMIGGVTAAVIGMQKAFGKLGGAVTLIVGGIALLVTGFKDAEKNGVNFTNALTILAGVVATGLGFAKLTGSTLPAVIAGFAAVLAAIAFATGHGEELIGGVRKVIDGFKEFFSGIFAGDMEQTMAGLNMLWEGMQEVVSAVWDGIKDASKLALDWLDEKTNGKVSEIIDWIKQFFTKEYWIDVFNALPEGMQDVLSSLWDSVVETFNNISTKISGILDSIFGVKKAASGISVPSSSGRTTRIASNPDMGISTYGIPALARGSVIPPNAPFLAMLGDQKKGTNIEAPLDTIQQAVAEVMGDNIDAMMAGFEAVVRAIQEKDTTVQIGDDDIHAANKRYDNKMSVVLGV